MITSINLTTDLVNAVLQYLGTRPFQEVAQMVTAIQKEATPQVQAAATDVADVTEA